MKRFAIGAFITTTLLLLILPSQLVYFKFFLGAFGYGLAIVFLLIGKLPWENDNM